MIYGLGDILNRLASFLLLPLYTNYLTPGEFGSLELLYMTSAIISMFLGRQLSHATLRFYFEYDDRQDRKAVISTAFTCSFIFSGVCLIICSALADRFSLLVFDHYDYALHFGVVFLSILLEMSNEILFAYIRALEKSVFFIVLSFLGLVIRFCLVIYLVAYRDFGILGVLFGNLSGVFVLWIVLSIFMLVKCGLVIHRQKVVELLKYTLPLVFVGFGGVVIANTDRFMLKYYVSLSAVGIYALALRFKSVLTFLIINPFTRGYGPFRFSIMKQSNAKEIYSRVTTHFCLLLCWMWLIMSVLSQDVIVIMAKETYYDAYRIIPILLVSGVAQGLYYMFQIGIYIHKNTRVLARLVGLVAIFNVATLFVIVPFFKEPGAAVIHAMTHVCSTIGCLWLSQKVYPIEYEWKRMVALFLLAVGLFGAAMIPSLDSIVMSIAYKCAVILMFPAFLYMFGFFRQEELDKVASIKNQLKTRILAARS